MKVQELLVNIKNKEFKLERELDVKKYLPIEAKKTIAQGIIYDCTSEESGAIKVDSVQKYVSYVRYMITMHTNLEYTDEDYDTLCSTVYGDTNLLNAVMGCFDEDAKECSRILELMMSDYMQEATIEFAVVKLLNELGGTINNFVKNISNKVSDVDFASMIPDNVDMTKLGAFLQNYIK